MSNSTRSSIANQAGSGSISEAEWKSMVGTYSGSIVETGKNYWKTFTSHANITVNISGTAAAPVVTMDEKFRMSDDFASYVGGGSVFDRRYSTASHSTESAGPKVFVIGMSPADTGKGIKALKVSAVSPRTLVLDKNSEVLVLKKNGNLYEAKWTGKGGWKGGGALLPGTGNFAYDLGNKRFNGVTDGVLGFALNSPMTPYLMMYGAGHAMAKSMGTSSAYAQYSGLKFVETYNSMQLKKLGIDAPVSPWLDPNGRVVSTSDPYVSPRGIDTRLLATDTAGEIEIKKKILKETDPKKKKALEDQLIVEHQKSKGQPPADPAAAKDKEAQKKKQEQDKVLEEAFAAIRR